MNYGGMTLTVTDDAPWQQLWGGAVPGERLAEAIASGDPRYNMGQAGPRPFHQAAEQNFVASGEFDRCWPKAAGPWVCGEVRERKAMGADGAEMMKGAGEDCGSR